MEGTGEMPLTRGKPHEDCKASQEALLGRKKNPLDIDDYCPICERRGIICEVGSHPTARVLEEQELLRLQEQRVTLTAGRF